MEYSTIQVFIVITNTQIQNWLNIQRDLGVSLKPWSINERDTVLLCLQRNGGWSMKGKDVVSGQI